MAKLSDYGLVALPEFEHIDVQQVNSGRGHKYVVTGIKEKLTSVTTFAGVINKPFLMPWARKVASERFRDRMFAIEDANKPGEDGYTEYINEVFEWAKKEDTSGRDDGTATHNLIENILAGTKHIVTGPVQARVQPAVTGALSTIRMLGLTTVGMEIPIWHPDEMYAGMIDYLGRDQSGGLVIIDWKRAKNWSDDYSMQVSAYAAALLAVLQLSRHTDVTAKVVKLPREEGDDVEVRTANITVGWDRFCKAKALHEALGDKGDSPWE